ncbi:PQQ-dependent sugar dehydrogenase [Virgibacillus sp. C22-A2]|uniref:PQQ-dependent sugar dehydrogenase n=1 Tax=Virgibacillus tibetensis TaxID=3042313 RepID=A0ABU6KHL7_9BACI|nr:PQQ-dependent sugar dehydrogenase [Virgibacillus sp. C22-A2]
MRCSAIRYFFFIVSAVVVLTACENSDQPTERDTHQGEQKNKNPEQDAADTDRKVIAENLQEPWAIAILDDEIHVSERNGAIVTISDGDYSRKSVQFDKNLAEQPEAGLLGIAFSDDYPETNEAIAYYSYQNGDDYFQRVVRIEESSEQWVETDVLLDRIPGGQFHQGGRIEIGPDHKLYITTGDAANPELSQDLNSLAGKILRMNLDGSIPEDNPFDNSFVYSYGHRNPQGLAWGPNGEFYATEHGAEAHDEINRVEAGGNYGWPAIEGDETGEGMEPPVIHSGNETWAPSGMTYFNGNFYFAALRGEALRKFDPMNKSEELIVSDVGRVRDALATDDGIYIITNNTDGRGTPSENDDQLLFIPIPKSQLH